MSLIDHLDTEADLDAYLSAPSAADVDLLPSPGWRRAGPRRRRKNGAVARAAHRATRCRQPVLAHRVIAASRFSSPPRDVCSTTPAPPRSRPTCSIRPVSTRCPTAHHVLFLAGRKFGSTDNTALTWATNTIAPANIARRFVTSRIVAFSTGNVYPFVPVSSRGSVETDAPAPRGEYAQSCLGRERVFEHYSRKTARPRSCSG